MEVIPTPTLSDILLNEFMAPGHVTVDELAERTGISIASVQNILYYDAQITYDTSKRLGHFWNVSDRYFWNIQGEIHVRNN